MRNWPFTLCCCNYQFTIAREFSYHLFIICRICANDMPLICYSGNFKDYFCAVCARVYMCVLPVHVCAHVCVTHACIHVDACTPRTTFGGGFLFSTVLRQSHVFLWLLCYPRLAGPKASVPASKLTADMCHCTRAL